MLRELKLEYFKCFEQLSIPLAPLTLLSGLNSSGKSSTIQALALLCQTIAKNEWGSDLLLNGDLVRLGSMGDVVNDAKGRNLFAIGIRDDQCLCEWRALCDDRKALTAPLETVHIVGIDGEQHVIHPQPILSDEGKVTRAKTNLHKLIPVSHPDRLFPPPEVKALSDTIGDLVYITAERMGPRETHDVFSNKNSRNVGPNGERTAWTIYNFGKEDVSDHLRLDDVPPTLHRQVSAWLNLFFPRAEIKVDPVEGANLVILQVKTTEGGEFHRPQNVGFGLTHVLPILTACLAAKPGEVLLIENPESHLHPAGQSEMGRFLALTAKAGVQVIFETHSDHTLNGVRKAVAAGYLPPDQITLNFFRQKSLETGEFHTSCQTIPVDKHGRITQWPDGFFDQIEKDLDHIFGSEDAGISE